MEVTLREITPENWRQATRLKVANQPVSFVAPNMYSLAQL